MLLVFGLSGLDRFAVLPRLPHEKPHMSIRRILKTPPLLLNLLEVKVDLQLSFLWAVELND